MDKKIWLQGLVAATIGGVANAAGVVGLDSQEAIDWTALTRAVIVGAIISVSAFLKKSPIPGSANESK